MNTLVDEVAAAIVKCRKDRSSQALARVAVEVLEKWCRVKLQQESALKNANNAYRDMLARYIQANTDLARELAALKERKKWWRPF